MTGEIHHLSQNGDALAPPAKDSRLAYASFSHEDRVKQLTQIWEEFLRVHSVGLDDNYFDLGGDSSTAARLFAEIEKIFHIKLPLATLFEAPTIRELAVVLENYVPSSSWSSLVAIQPGGNRPPFFCVHGAGGNILIYRDLSGHLGSDQPFYGLQAQGLDGKQPVLTNIEDMAARYVQEIRRFQPHGPYFLGGYCMGGTVAYEMAQQLDAAGEKVALLALFDAMNWCAIPRPGYAEKAYHSVERMVFHVANFAKLSPAGWVQFFREKMKLLRNRIPVWQGMLLAKIFRNPRTLSSEAALLAKIWKTNDKACVEYVPRPYPGTVTDFRPMKQYYRLRRTGAKWERLAQSGQTVVVLPVYPAGMLVEPFVARLADALRRAMDEAI